MKIAILSRYQDNTYRGVESVVWELSSRLVRRGYSVDILTGRESDAFSKIISGCYDVVMPMNGRMQSLKASLGRIVGKYKLVIGGHSGIGRDDIWNIAVCKPDVFIALTTTMDKWAKKWAWGSNVIKIPDGVDTDKFCPTGEKMHLDLPRPVILSAGALVWYKHHDKVIKAVKELGKGSLVIAGEGSDKENLTNLGETLLGKNFKLISIKYEDMPKLYRACDLFTLPSWDREAFGVVYLEAMAVNIPVVAPDDDSRREIVGGAGILTNTDNTKLFTKAINDALNTDWKSKPREQAEKFSWEKVADLYEKCFKEITLR